MKRCLYIFFALCLFVSCSKNKNETTKQEITENAITVNVMKIQKGSLDDYLECGGDVEAESTVEVLPVMAGRLTQLFVNVGDYVNRNQLLAYIDPSRPGTVYSASPVLAPSSGTIISIMPSVGANVTPSTVILTLSSTNKLLIKINVPERFISRVSEGQEAQVRFSAYNDNVFNAKVTEVSPVLDPMSRTMQVTLIFTDEDENKKKLPKAGMYAKVNLTTEHKDNILVIPNNAIVQNLGKSYVYVVEGERAKKREIKTGLNVDNLVEVSDNLSQDEVIVVKGQSSLSDGQLVNAIFIEGEN